MILFFDDSLAKPTLGGFKNILKDYLKYYVRLKLISKFNKSINELYTKYYLQNEWLHQLDNISVAIGEIF